MMMSVLVMMTMMMFVWVMMMMSVLGMMDSRSRGTKVENADESL